LPLADLLDTVPGGTTEDCARGCLKSRSAHCSFYSRHVIDHAY
jgi:hypothetical protein